MYVKKINLLFCGVVAVVLVTMFRNGNSEITSNTRFGPINNKRSLNLAQDAKLKETIHQLTTNKSLSDIALFDWNVKEPLFLRRIHVWVNSAPERNLITETQGLDADINFENGGSYVYLESVWEFSKISAITDIKLIFDKSKCSHNGNSADLLAGASDKARCLKFRRENGKYDSPITKVGLVRSEKRPRSADIMRLGWNDCTTNINVNRAGFLYLCWNNLRNTFD